MSEKILKILVLFSHKCPMTVQEIVDKSGLPQSTVYRLLKVLRDSSFLVQRIDGFAPGPGLLEIARRGMEDFDITAYARPEMIRLSELSGETVLLTELSGDETMAVDVVHADQPIRFAFQVGQRRPAHAGASSKILFSAMSPARQKRLLALGNFEGKTAQTITDPGTLAKQLKEIRQCGYHVSRDEWEVGVLSVAATVITERGVWAISIVGLTLRFDEARIKEMITLVTDAAQRIEIRTAEMNSGAVDITLERKMINEY